MWLIEVLQGQRVVRAIELRGPLQVGRAPTCALSVLDPTVSGAHILIEPGPESCRLTDLRSTNGSFLEGERLREPTGWAPGQILRLGEGTCLRLRTSDHPQPWPALQVELLDSGVGEAFIGPTVDLGGGLELQRRSPTEIWALQDLEDLGPVRIGEVHELGGRRLRVVPGAQGLPATQPLRSLEVLGSLSALTLREEAHEHQVRAPNRVSLLFALARAWEAGSGAPEERGWLDDDEAAVAVWGRQRLEHLANNYNVLLSRVRRAMRDDGLSPHHLERRPGQTRLRCGSVALS